ncbi:hypothetical protein EYS14_10840 [Alteromonadaceae bacterium M269]|nr:hypothetical protein EYS14_10840 [Alteromonadaceae bacterium M269]
MKAKILVGLAACITSFSSMAARGYWEIVQVCDYEQVTVQEPKTACYYSGFLTGSGGVGIPFNINFTVNGHVSCSAHQYQTETRQEFNHSTGRWETVFYSGVVPLTGQSQFLADRVETQVVEGSCREERVWIRLCDNCQIP